MNNLKLLGLTAGVSSLLLTGTATADFTGISIDAIDSGADCVVTGCPLCHLSLDAYQPEVQKMNKKGYSIPILHRTS